MQWKVSMDIKGSHETINSNEEPLFFNKVYQDLSIIWSVTSRLTPHTQAEQCFVVFYFI